MSEILGKITDLLKANGWQTAMIAIVSAAFLYMSKAGIAPSIGSEIQLIIWLVMLVSAALAVASFASWAQSKIALPANAVLRRRAIRKARQSFIDYLPYLTERERQILGYLRHYKIKMFTGDHDGGYAATLLASGFVRYIGTSGQTFDIDKVLFAVPDHIWEMMEARPDAFPHRPELSDGHPQVEVHPWRIPWMLP